MANLNSFKYSILISGLLSCILAGVTFSSTASNNSQSSNRIKSDLQRDLTSKPKQVIEFTGVQKGFQVLDLFGGGGYYSELFAEAVGDDGHVTLHNNNAYLPFIGVELEVRLAEDRLKNVRKLMSEADDLELGESKYDLVVLVLGYHDFFYTSDKWNVTADKVMPQVLASLKKGGRFLVIDHNAVKGSQKQDAQKLHRIESSYAKQSILKYGFSYIKESAILRNSGDPLNIKVFEPKIRRKTDRFVFLFEKR